MQVDALISQLHQEILFARQRVYAFGERTPMETINLPEWDCQLTVKREDRSPINAYKWRGACNRMAVLNETQRQHGVVTASAGNHAQGVALAAALLKIHAKIFMPVSTPRMKQVAVRKHGGNWVEIELVGNSYDEACSAAYTFTKQTNRTFIHAYDDLQVMGGQGTLADEIVLSGQPPFDAVFLQVGGGGLAAAVGTWLRMHYPHIQIIGVEGVEQASMAAAIAAGKPVTLNSVDVFCDGTAVRRVGDLTFSICNQVVNHWITVTNESVSAAIAFLWEQLRCIPEPSGAMGVAGALQMLDKLKGKRVLSLLCGANMDFEQLQLISAKAALGANRRHYLRVSMNEQPGELRRLLATLPSNLSIVDLQYGRANPICANPIIGIEATEPVLTALRQQLITANFKSEEVTDPAHLQFRVIRYNTSLMHSPLFLSIEFHERPGALDELLQALGPEVSICYFNYAYSGERVGRALIGFDLPNNLAYDEFMLRMDGARCAYRRYTRIKNTAFLE
jgi:threonine dehydratase